MSTPRVSLLVLGSADCVQSISTVLADQPIDLTGAPDLSSALAALDDKPFDSVLVDWNDHGAATRDVLRKHPDAWIIAMVAGGLNDAVDAMRAGAGDALHREPSLGDLLHAIEKALARAAHQVDEPPPVSAAPGGLLGESEPMQRVFKMIGRAAPGTATVLIRGESGTGKELVARAIVEQSPRRDRPFVQLQCAALPETLLESELFGYERGAFTGATARKPGRVEVAEGGTLFLDEIGDITPAMQVKLLRLLQERKYERLGGTETRSADVRFIAATHRDLESMVKSGDFREDLFYRLNVVPLWLPPLRGRGGDVALLARTFCRRFGDANGRPQARLGDDAVRALEAERWPGNVRQLQNFIERLIVLCDDDLITADDVRREMSQGQPITTHASRAPSTLRTADITRSQIVPLTEEVRQAERKALVRALKYTRGNRTLAARILCISRATLYNKLVEHGLS